MTFFAIFDEDDAPRLRPNEPFVPIGEGVWTTDPDLPERAIAFDHEVIQAAVDAAGLRTAELLPGAWHAWTHDAQLHKDVFVLARD